jgi:hypothetical protein
MSAKDHNLLSPVDWQKYAAETIEVRKMTYTYRKRVLEDD